MFPALVVSALLSAAPTYYTYELLLENARVGAVRLELSGTTYRYGSVHVMNRGGEISRRRKGDVFELMPESKTWRGSVPATLAIVTMAAEKGCVDVVDEVTRKLGTFCVTAREGTRSSGTLLGKKFTVVLDEEGLARSVSFPDFATSFQRVPFAVEPSAPPDFTGKGYPVSGTGRLAVSPAVAVTVPKLSPVKEADARAWFKAVSGEDHMLCMDFARAFVKRAPVGSTAIVHGVRVEDEVAYPHAWVRVVTERGPLELDPTFGAEVNAVEYLPLHYVTGPADETAAGALWLSFINGKRRVSRTED